MRFHRAGKHLEFDESVGIDGQNPRDAWVGAVVADDDVVTDQAAPV
jgi:hypothetical protein